MGHTDKIDATDTLVPNGDLTTRKLNLLESIPRLASTSRIFRAGAVTVAMLALISCTTSPRQAPRAPLAPIAPLRQLTYDIPCEYADSLPKIANHGVWMCERYINTCSCVPVSRQSIFGR